MIDSIDGISVIICCYNSATRLPITLKHLAQQKFSADIPWEIILVNNASTDNTSGVGKKEWTQYDLTDVGFKIVDEPTAGLSNARHKGVAEANFEYIIFCDDDNWLDEDYLQTAYKLISSNDEIGAVGGQSDFVSDIDGVPAWFYENRDGYAVGKQAEFSGNLTERGFLWGSGLTLKKANYLIAFENFPSLLSDRKGTDLSSGGDSEICMRFILMRYELYYSEELRFTHFISKERLNTNYFNKLFAGFKASTEIINKYKIAKNTILLKTLDKGILLLKSLLRICCIKICLTNRWEIRHESLQTYLISGIKFSPIDKEIALIKTWHMLIAKK